MSLTLIFNKKVLRAFFYLAAIICFQNVKACEYVAHAGGGIAGKTYTNSIEAIANSYNRGFRLIEVDFSPSSEGDWFCLHDLSEVEIGRGESWLIKTVDRFLLQFISKHYDHEWLVHGLIAKTERIKSWIEAEAESTGFHHCTLPEVAAFAQANPDVYVITDTKYWNKRLLISLSSLGRDFFIPQVYSVDEFFFAKSLGFEKIIYSLYKEKGYDGVTKLLDYPQLYAITIPVSWYLSDLQSDFNPYQGLSKYSGRLFVHTLNECFHFSEPKPTGIYTDWLLPGSLPLDTCR